MIFTNCDISSQDLKSLRLVQKSWTGMATNQLFHRVCLSRLVKDRDVFFNIAKHPHLATIPRMLVWYELESDISWHEIDELSDDIDEDYPPEFYADIGRQILVDTFWSTPQSNLHMDEQILTKQASNLDDFLLQFWTALDAMPQLRTFVSQPMPPCRQLTTSPTAYPATAQLLHGKPHHVDVDIPRLDHTLLGTAVTGHRHTNTSKRGPFSRFYFSDSGGSSTLQGIQFKHLHSLFPALTHLDMYISRKVKPSYVQALQSYIMTEKELTHLRICFERHNSLFLVGGKEIGAFELLFGHVDFYLPKLRSLHVAELMTPPGLLLHVVKRHAKTLKSLRVDENIKPHILPKFLQLTRENRLELEQLSIVPSNTKRHGLLVLDFPAHESLAVEEDRYIPLQIELNQFAYVCSLDASWKVGGWKIAAIIESPLERVDSCVYSKEEMALLDSNNRDLRYCVTRPDQESLDQEITPLHIHDNQSDLASTDDKVSGEDASHLRHLKEPPWWKYYWGISGGFTHYQRCADEDKTSVSSSSKETSLQVDQTSECHRVPTEMWFFQHRNGEVAFGDEPLEF